MVLACAGSTCPGGDWLMCHMSIFAFAYNVYVSVCVCMYIMWMYRDQYDIIKLKGSTQISV